MSTLNAEVKAGLFAERRELRKGEIQTNVNRPPIKRIKNVGGPLA